MAGRLEGKVAVVMGAGAGIGAAIARRLSDDGARVVLAARTEQRLVEQVEAIGAGDARLAWRVTDVTDRADVEGLIAFAGERFGGLDILINNVGVGILARLPEVTPEAWRTLFATDVDSVFHACRAAIPLLRERGGAIVNIASVAGGGGDPAMTPYNAAKAAVINLTRGIAVEQAVNGIRANCVSPGVTDTPTVTARMPRALRDAWEAAVPMGRLADPSEIAAVVAFLASDDASYITGQDLRVDGGLTAQSGSPNVAAILGR